jgi:ariadne-1
MKWCPNPGCSNVIRCERKNRKEAVTCKCGFSFCFNCADSEIGDHMPATCENVEMWMKKATDESENVKWLIANTKK